MDSVEPRRLLARTLVEAGRRTLRDLNRDAFAVPTTGKIAIKVINHYGDEVMQVCGRRSFAVAPAWLHHPV